MTKNIAIIGGSGFIGSRLCNRLSKRPELDFTILDLAQSKGYAHKWRKADIKDYESLLQSLPGHDIVINLAAEHQDNINPTSKYYETNVDGQKNICRAMDALGIRSLIFTSSVAVYGFVTEDTGEDGKIAPFHEYGDSKHKAELVSEEWFSEGKQLSVIRPTVVFGENNRGNVYNLLRQIASGKFIMIGKGENKKSMAYVENIAAFIEHLVDNGSNHQIFNYIDKPDFNMNTLVKTVNSALERKTSKIKIPYSVGLAGGIFFDILSKLTKKKFPISKIRVKKFCARTQFRTNTDMLGFKPPVTLEDGLSKTVKNEF